MPTSLFVAALSWLEIVGDIERDAAVIVALALVYVNAVGVHAPVVVGSVENVGCGELLRPRTC